MNGQAREREKQGAKARTARPRRRFKLLILAGSILCFLVLAEAVLQFFLKEHLGLVRDERSLLYRYDSSLGWFPKANTTNEVVASRRITAIHNSNGFRTPEGIRRDRPAIVFLGDSYLWGYDVEGPERFTDKLQGRHPEWSVYNLGVSGYGTDQEYLLLQQWFDALKPRVVFLLFCTDNDGDDNSSNVRYGGYYKPYYAVVGNRLELRGVPVPKSEMAFLEAHGALAQSCLVRLAARAWFKLNAPAKLTLTNPTGYLLRYIEHYVRLNGAVFVVGLTGHRPFAEKFLDRYKIPYVQLSNSFCYPSFGEHWTPEGHDYVCDKVEEFLVRGNFMGSTNATGE